MKNNKKKDKNKIIKRREFILNFLNCFNFFSIVIVLSVGAILEDKGYELNAGFIATSTVIYGAFMIWLTYHLSIKWGATKVVTIKVIMLQLVYH